MQAHPPRQKRKQGKSARRVKDPAATLLTVSDVGAERASASDGGMARRPPPQIALYNISYASFCATPTIGFGTGFAAREHIRDTARTVIHAFCSFACAGLHRVGQGARCAERARSEHDRG